MSMTKAQAKKLKQIKQFAELSWVDFGFWRKTIIV